MNHPPVIIADIDGVLNGHETPEGSPYCGVRPDCMERLNRIIVATEARLVLCSAWRYLVHNGRMTLAGLEYLLFTHGLLPLTPEGAHGRLIGITRSDRTRDEPRIYQVADWLGDHPEVDAWVVIDDLPRISPRPSRFVQTHAKRGLTDANAEAAVRILREKPE